MLLGLLARRNRSATYNENRTRTQSSTSSSSSISNFKNLSQRSYFGDSEKGWTQATVGFAHRVHWTERVKFLEPGIFTKNDEGLLDAFRGGCCGLYAELVGSDAVPGLSAR